MKYELYSNKVQESFYTVLSSSPLLLFAILFSSLSLANFLDDFFCTFSVEFRLSYKCFGSKFSRSTRRHISFHITIWSYTYKLYLLELFYLVVKEFQKESFQMRSDLINFSISKLRVIFSTSIIDIKISIIFSESTWNIYISNNGAK